MPTWSLSEELEPDFVSAAGGTAGAACAALPLMLTSTSISVTGDFALGLISRFATSEGLEAPLSAGGRGELEGGSVSLCIGGCTGSAPLGSTASLTRCRR